MNRPIDPRKHGFIAPERVYKSKLEKIYLRNQPDIYSNRNISLQTVVNLWTVAWRDHESQGHRLVSGPDLVAEYGSPHLSYTYECDNFGYKVQLDSYNQAVAVYEDELKAFEEYQAKLKAKDYSASALELDVKIERARERLANLLAIKAGEPLPYVSKETLDERRAREKKESRDQDAADLASGKKTQEDLRKENGIFALPDATINFNKAKLY